MRCASRASSRTTPRWTKVAKETIAALPEEQAAAQGRGEGHPHGAAGEGAARRDSRSQRAPRRPQVRRDPSHHHRDQGAAPRARLRACSPAAKPRRWSPPRSAPRTTSRRSSTSTASTWKRFMLHYNFPPFSVGEVEADARPRPPRDRPRRPRRARARADDARRSSTSRTPSASSPTSSSRTAARRWPRSAAARWR